jgi:hypothetical protein
MQRSAAICDREPGVAHQLALDGKQLPQPDPKFGGVIKEHRMLLSRPRRKSDLTGGPQGAGTTVC